MGRSSRLKPRQTRPHVLLGNTSRISHGGRGKKMKTLIGQASRELYNARRADDADALRDMLLAADPSEYLTILSAFVDFFPGDAIPKHPVGDPRVHWAVNAMLAGRKALAGA